MIGILLISHGKMAEGIKDSVEMIVGQAEQFETLALIPGQDIEELKTNIRKKTEQLNSGNGVIILVDLYGASPHNASMACIPEWEKQRMNIRVISGMNLPMTITAVCNRDFSTISDLTLAIIEAGQQDIRDVIAELQASKKVINNDDY